MKMSHLLHPKFADVELMDTFRILVAYKISISRLSNSSPFKSIDFVSRVLKSRGNLDKVTTLLNIMVSEKGGNVAKATMQMGSKLTKRSRGKRAACLFLWAAQ